MGFGLYMHLPSYSDRSGRASASPHPSQVDLRTRPRKECVYRRRSGAGWQETHQWSARSPLGGGGAKNRLRSHDDLPRTHDQNLAEAMYPTDQPLARAELCISCHFGNERKFVDHRMMGVGHPRLRGLARASTLALATPIRVGQTNTEEFSLRTANRQSLYNDSLVPCASPRCAPKAQNAITDETPATAG